MNDLTRLHEPLRDELQEAIEKVIAESQFIQGRRVAEFEGRMAQYLGVRHAIGVSSGTAALELALKAIDVQGQPVLTTAFSFAATATAIMAAGGIPHFVDIDRNSFQMDLQQVFDLLPRIQPKVILPVHLFGRVLDIQPLCDWASTNGAYVVEDAAQAFGARGNVMAGVQGDIGCFSFYPTKNLGGMGDGGMIVTNDDRLADSLRRLREPIVAETWTQGATNARLDGLQAAILLVKLPYLQHWNHKRLEIARRYTWGLAGCEAIACPEHPAGSIVHQYTIRVPDRNRLQSHLMHLGIETRVYYQKTLPDYLLMDEYNGRFPRAETATREVLSLPVSPTLTWDEQQTIIDAIIDHAASYAREHELTMR